MSNSYKVYASQEYVDELNSATETRVATLEAWHEDFVECTEEEILALFE